MKRNSVKSAFTLIELMAALTVCGLVILSCGVMMQMAGGDRVTVQRSIAWQREAGRVTELLREDLTTAHGKHWHEGAGEDVCEVGWLSLKPLKSQSDSRAVGDLCAVGYRLVDREVGPGQVQGILLRQQVDSATVFEAIRAGAMDSLWDIGPQAEPVAQGVLIFEIWPLLRDNSQSWQPWYSVLSAMPDAVELRMVLASPELQERLRSREDWDAARWDPGQFDGDEIHEVRSLIRLGNHAH